jgi:hypothetical protein
VTNSVDLDEDVLTYSFEVYGDSSMAGPPIASVTGVPQGADGSTSWTLDKPLIDNAWYFWRALARDEHGASRETAVASFFVNTANDAPGLPAVFYPENGSEVSIQELDLMVTNATDVDGDPLTYFFELDKVNTFDSLQRQAPSVTEVGLAGGAFHARQHWYFWR